MTTEKPGNPGLFCIGPRGPSAKKEQAMKYTQVALAVKLLCHLIKYGLPERVA